MKSLLRSYLISLISLYLASLLIKGFTYQGGLPTLFLGAGAFTVINWFVRPIVKILMLPINILSLGLLSWLTNVVLLYILTLLVPQITIKSWNFSGLNIEGFTIPGMQFSVILTYIAVSFAISFIASFLHWLTRK